MKTWLSLLSAIALLASANSFATPIVVNVATEHLQGYTNHDGSGFYYDVLNRIFPAPIWQLNVQVLPFSRVRYLLKHERVHMGLGFYQGDMDNILYSKKPVEIDSVDVALSPKMAQHWRGINSLSNKKVLALLAYRFDDFIDVPMHYEESSDLLSMLNRVNDGKVDAVLDYKPSMLRLSNQLNRPRQFQIIEAVIKAPVFFVFANNSDGVVMKAHFDQYLAVLISSGELDRMFDVYVKENDRYGNPKPP
ncbi:substrate-binding periplasmic protein [Shewanella waksmanii]|uniref:substrate-binding periplasmic protein n=1 Tax=Shewanella waksmanii TaxID=213783 RepID=UPI003736C103